MSTRTVVSVAAGTVLFVAIFAFASKVQAPHSNVLQNIRTANPARILFVGDIMLDRHIRTVMARESGDFVFSCVKDFLWGADLVVGNLEGPITEHHSISLGTAPSEPGNFVFTFAPEVAELLAAHNIRVVNIGNNHIGDFGPLGTASTRYYLGRAGVSSFGGPPVGGVGDEPVYRATVGETQLSLVSYNEFGGASPEKVAQAVARERSSGRIVVVYAHWGDEYAEVPLRVRTAARLFADAGASAIIGSHPHIVLGPEYLGGALVYFSLGNFIFDQYFSEETRRGLAVLLAVSPSGVTGVVEYPVETLQDGRTCLLVE